MRRVGRGNWRRRRIGATSLLGLRVVASVAFCAAIATAAVLAVRASDAATPSAGLGDVAAGEPLIVAFGDSLLTQVKLDLRAQLAGLHVVQHSDPGVAACHYLATVRSYVRTHRPAVAILEFWGNDNKDTTCVNRYAMQSPGYDASYDRTVTSMVHALVAVGAHVFLVGLIPDASEVASHDPRWDRLNRIYAGIAASFGGDATFLNIQQVVERDGRFTWELSCLPKERSCDAAAPKIRRRPPAGENVIRSIDGLHFCPQYPTSKHHYYDVVMCDTYSSGEFRYASFITGVVKAFLLLHRAPTYVGQPLPPPGQPVLGIPGQVDPYSGAIYPQR